MATPVGHSLAGYAVYNFFTEDRERRQRHLLLLSIFMASAPDLDFLPGLLMGAPARYHQGITHSLGFILVISLTAAGVYRLRGWSFSTIFKLCFVSSLSHLIIDFFGHDGRPPYGQPLFWPFSADHFISPIPVFWGMRHASSTFASTAEWIQGILDPHNLGALALEIICIAPLVLAAKRHRRHRLQQHVAEMREA